uniref:Peptidase A1 domain-containing protein n=1 Tax=Oryza rufipogon TaxID=4529 RepID=A0A0E0N7E0_ORYRU
MALPSSIRQLMLLAYLDVSGLPIAALPKYLHMFQNMQTLILSNCSLETLPANIGNLHKLCYLDLSGNSDLSKLPTSFGNLLKLSLLSLSGCTKLEELPESIHNLKCLEQLDMSGCCALQKLPDEFGSLSKLSFVNLTSCSKLTKLPGNFNLESLEHLILSDCHELENLPEDFGILYRLEVLDLSDCYKIPVLPESFCQLKHLKDLNLSDCHGLKQLPECFGDLSELQFLNLTSCSKLQSLPQSLCNIFKLKHLNLSYCIRIEHLPSLFGDLQLQVLNLTCCYSLRDMPDSISDMASLTLLDVISGTKGVLDKAWSIKECLNLPGREEHDVHEIENGECCSIVELGKLSCRALGIQHLENVERLDNAREAKLRDMTDLRELTLSWGLGGTRNVDKDEEVLENLLPPRTLESFMLDGYMCKDFPNWVSGISSYLPCLIYLCLSNLATCDSLPAFGRLPNLRFFCMENMPTIRKIGREFYDGEGNCKKLRIIWLERMDNFEEWWTTRSGEEDREFLIPNLHFLKAVDCPKLSFLPYPPRSMHWSLDNSDKVLPERGFGSLASSTLPFRVVINNCKYPPDMWVRFQHLATIEIFQVEGCSGLRTFPDILQSFVSLRELYLCSWENLEILPEWLGQLICLEVIEFINCPVLTTLPTSLQNLTSLRELLLRGCKGLETLPEGMGRLISLEKFIIMDCPKLTFLPESMKNLTALIELHLDGCKGLETLPEGLGLLISLKKFVISNCPKLTYLPESMKKLAALIELRLDGCKRLETLPKWLGLLISLKKIVINNYPMLTFLPESMKNLTAMKVLYLYGCKELEILPEGLGMLISLEKFVLIDCPKLTFLPESMKNLTALIELRLDGCKGLEILPEGLGLLISLEKFIINNCPKLTFLPESMKNLTALIELWLDGCKGLEILPEGLGLLICLEKFIIMDCPKLTFLPESMKNLTALIRLLLDGCKGLEILPEWLGMLVSLEEFIIIDCPKLTFLPSSMKNLTAITELRLDGCKGLEILPEGLGLHIPLKRFVINDCPMLTFLPELLGHLTALKCLDIQSSPNLTYLPESMKNLTALEELLLEGFNSLPEWIGQFIYLKEISIFDSPNLTSLPESIWNITTLELLYIYFCPRLAEWCQREDANKISRIPKIMLDGEKYLYRDKQSMDERRHVRRGVSFFGSGPYNLMPLSADAVRREQHPLLQRPRSGPMNPSTNSIYLRGISVNQEEVRPPPSRRRRAHVMTRRGRARPTLHRPATPRKATPPRIDTVHAEQDRGGGGADALLSPHPVSAIRAERTHRRRGGEGVGGGGRAGSPSAERWIEPSTLSPSIHRRKCSGWRRLDLLVLESLAGSFEAMSGVGEMIASSVARRVASKLGDLAVEEATLLWRFKDDVNDMKEKMRDLVAVMQDADDKVRQVGKDGAVARRWLSKVKSVAYDVEDVLDEFDAAQLIRNHQSKLKLYFSWNNPLLQKMTIARNMKNLRDKIVAIEKDGKMLNLVRHEPHAKGSRSNETFTVSDDMEIGMLGRDAETEKIISLLLKTEAKEDISIIPIVGLGGLGKTTLAQAVFADKRVSVFDMKIWVYVSEDFDLLKIGKAIIRGANRSISLDNCNLQFVQDNLIKELANRRYLIGLDDLWEEYGENLEKLKQMLQHGGKGSKIIVTTRNGSVVQVLHTGCLANQRKICPVHEADHINLDVLSPDDCWKVMKQRIFGPDDDQSGLEEIGRQIAGRCGGLPLVANALGQVMSEQRTVEAWRDIRDRKIVLDFIVDNRRDTLERVLLSYYYMKPDYKMCFTCLASFSKGFVVDSDCLILQWSALGYIQARHTGQSCIDYLLGMSFLQISKSSSNTAECGHSSQDREHKQERQDEEKLYMHLQASPSPAIQALVAPITKDTKTGLHTLSISNKNYLLDLSGQLLWSPCSPSHPTVPCSSGECAAASGAHKSCNNGGRACTARPTNPVTGERAVGDLTLADIVANATDGKTLTSEVTVRGVVSSCAPGSLLRSLPAMAAGDAGLGRGGVSLPTQLYSKLSLKRQFAVCLPSTAAAPGVAFFGGGPYNLMPPTLFDASTVLSYTDLARSPTNPSAYSIKLRGIAMNQEAVHLPPGALSRGGGVTLDTAAPYTVLRRDVYRPFVAAFAKATARITRMPSVAPFELCFNSSALGFTRVGYAVAPIDLVTSGGRNWTVFGSNSLAQVAGDTACLAFVDGGRAARSAVTVGAFQMENNFLLFDEAASRLGFSGTLFFIRTTCGNFNFARN